MFFDLNQLKFTYFNRHLLVHLGYSDEQIQEMGNDFLFKIIHPKDFTATVEYAKSFKDKRDDEVTEYVKRLKGADGKWHWMHSSELIFNRTASGEPVEIIGSAQDITEVKEYEQKLLKINESKDRVLATVAHDLRNPIQSIKGLVYVFRMQFEGLTDDDYEMLDMVDSSCQKAINLIAELLGNF